MLFRTCGDSTLHSFRRIYSLFEGKSAYLSRRRFVVDKLDGCLSSRYNQLLANSADVCSSSSSPFLKEANRMLRWTVTDQWKPLSKETCCCFRSSLMTSFITWLLSICHLMGTRTRIGSSHLVAIIHSEYTNRFNTEIQPELFQIKLTPQQYHLYSVIWGSKLVLVGHD